MKRSDELKPTKVPMSSSIDSEQEAIIKESSLYDEIAEWCLAKLTDILKFMLSYTI